MLIVFVFGFVMVGIVMGMVDVLMWFYIGDVFGVLLLIFKDGKLVVCCGFGYVDFEYYVLVMFVIDYWFVLVSK